MEVCGRGLGREVQDLQNQPGGEIGRLRKEERILYGGGGMECHVWHFGQEPMNLSVKFHSATRPEESKGETNLTTCEIHQWNT